MGEYVASGSAVVTRNDQPVSCPSLDAVEVSLISRFHTPLGFSLAKSLNWPTGWKLPVKGGVPDPIGVFDWSSKVVLVNS